MGSLAGLVGLDAADGLGGGPPDGPGVLAEVDGDRVGSDVDGDDLPGVDPAIHPVLVNGEPGLLVTSAGARDYVAALDLDHDNRRTAIRLIRNPDKLAHLDTR
jgi:hypothetical protein